MYLKRALRGTVIVFIFTVLAGISWYLFRFVLIRNLTIEEYGLFFSVYSLFALLGVIIDAGFGQAVPKFLIDLNAKHKKKEMKSVLYFSVIFQFIISSFLFILLLISSGWLSKHYFHHDVSLYILILGEWFVTIPLMTLLNHVFTGFHKYEVNSSIDFIRALTLTLVSILLISLGKGILVPFIAYAGINIFLFLVYAPFFLKTLRDLLKQKLEVMFKLYMEVFKYGLMVSISSIIWIVLMQADTLIITYFLGVEAVGLYQVAVPLASILLYVVGAIIFVAYPMSAELFAKKKFDELRAGINIFYKYIFVVLVPLILILFAFSTIVITMLFGAKYQGAAFALQILSIGALFSSITLFNNSVLAAIGKPQIVARTMGFTAFLNVVLCFILIPIFGINGAAVSASFSFFISLLLSTYSMNNLISLKAPISSWLKIVLLGIATTGIIYLLKYLILSNGLLELAIILVVSGAFYISGCFLLKIVEIDELKHLLKVAK